MKGFYNTTKAIKDFLELNINIGTVIMGEVSEADLKKQSMYPIGNILVDSASFPDNIVRFTVSVTCMDIVDETKLDLRDETEPFFSQDNKQDILNSMLSVVNDLSLSLKKGTLREDLFEINGEPTALPFEDRFEHLLTGWTITFDVDIPNNGVIC